MSQFKEDIEKMKFSYSRMTSYENCPYGFYLNYILKDRQSYPPENNFYAENGSCAHETFEAVLKNEISVYDAPEKYTELFNNIESKVKPSIMENKFNATLNTFMNLPEDWLDGYEVVGVEMRIDTLIHDVPFYGFIDLLLRDTKDGRLVLFDHKSAPPFFKKNGGGVYANLKRQYHEYKTQAYLYCKMIFDQYGEFPKEIVWNHFGYEGQWTVIPFDENEYREALDWFDEIYELICEDENFNPKEFLMNPEVKPDEFFCNNLCNFRSSCEYIKVYNRKRWKKK